MSTDAVLTQILAQLETLQVGQQTLQAKLDALSGSSDEPKGIPIARAAVEAEPSSLPLSSSISQTSVPTIGSTEREKSLYPGRVLLTTYPSQTGINPFGIKWGADTATARGPVICSRLPSSIKRRNALGAHSGSYSIYRALSIAMGTLNPTHKPNYTNTQPPVDIPPNPSWFDPGKIVSMDPWGHLVPTVFRKELEEEGVDVRPSIAITKARIKLSEIDESARKGEITIDGKIVLGVEGGGVEINVSKAAVEPVWWLPGVAERFGISESLLRRALFEDTGGMYPELITRPDIKVFLPPIGGLTVYICQLSLICSSYMLIYNHSWKSRVYVRREQISCVEGP